jgi:NodT family efflux transporter outer membrane factor (OMF) lipoprotein
VCPLKIGVSEKVMLCCLALMLSAGCAVAPKDVEPLCEIGDSFSASGVEPLPEKWWLSLSEPKLNDLIDEALAGNFTIRSAWDRLTQAEQVARKAGASLLPQVNYSAGGERTRQESDSDTVYSTEYSAGLVASYEIDLWGRIRSSRQAAILDAQASREDIAAAAITLTANIAKTWYQLVESALREEIIARQVQTNKEVLEVVTEQFRKAQVGASDVFRQRQLVESTRGQFIQARENTITLQHTLAVLLGRKPATRWDATDFDLAEPPDLPFVSVPADVIRRRPDVIRYYKAVQAADMRVAAAIADKYPTISISSNVRGADSDLEDVFDNWLANLAANAAGPLFDADLRQAEVERTRAVLSQAINDYSQVVLDALREVEDALTQEEYQKQYLANVRTQLQLARTVYERTRQQYVKGQVDYLRVLDALVSLQRLETSELAARRLLVERRIDLCKAIAGGWELKRPAQARLDQ